MRDTWIDEHTGDELEARPGFRAELRAGLESEWARPARPARRRAPWKPIVWSAAAAALLIGVVASINRDDTKRIAATPTTISSPATAPPSTLTPDLVIPATGGPTLSPEIVATFDMPTDEGGPRVALLPDRYVVLPTDPSHFTGVVLSVDRDGNPLPDTRLESVPADLAGIVLGGYDGTLYVETYPAVENTQTTRAYRLDGDVWREVDSYFVEQNNDGVYRVTGAGLQLGDLVVIPAQSVIEDGAVAGLVSYTPPVTVLSRAVPNGTTTTWEISQAADPLLFPPTPLLFGDGLLFTGDTDALDGGNYVGILRQNGGNEFFRLDGWQVAGADDTTALFVDAADGKVRLGVITASNPSG